MPMFDVEIVTVPASEDDTASELEHVVRFKIEAADKHAARELAEGFRGQPIPPDAERFERRRI